MSIGIDFGYSNVKIVELSKSGTKYKVEKLGIRPLTADLAKYNPEKIGKSQWVSAIQDLCKELKIQTKKSKIVISNISGHHVSARQVSTLEMSHDELELTLELEAKKHIPLDGSDPILDFHIIGPSATELDKINVLLLATTKNIIERHNDIMKDAGFKTGNYDTDSIALLNCYLNNNELPQTGVDVILNIGSSTTQMIIWGRNHPFFFREIELSGYHFTKYIADKEKIDFAHAQQIMIEKGTNYSPSGSSESPEDSTAFIQVAEKTIYDQLVDDLRKTLRYYMKNNNQAFFNKFYISGGSSRIPGLNEFIGNALNIKLMEMNPFENMEVSESVENVSQFSIATGLAIRGLEQDNRG
jgi:type IV pilus assembly protein PilM